jgi:hypothetical protein
MAPLVLTNAKILLGGYNLSGYANNVALNSEIEMLDDTVFGTSGTRSNKPGLKNITLAAGMFWDTAIDAMMFARIGATSEVTSIAPIGVAEGDTVYFYKSLQGAYQPVGGGVGEIMRGDLDGKAAGVNLVRGHLMATGAKLVTGTGTGAVYGLCGAGKRIFSALHVTAIGGSAVPTITGIIESDDNVGFTSATTRLTHTAMTAIGSNWQQANGPIATDTYWRASWTISGTDPSLTVFWSFGIL